MNREKDGEQTPATDRREFIKKMVYLAPVMETFLLTDEAEGQNRGNRGNSRQVSPVPGNRGNSRKG